MNDIVKNLNEAVEFFPIHSSGKIEIAYHFFTPHSGNPGGWWEAFVIDPITHADKEQLSDGKGNTLGEAVADALVNLKKGGHV